MTLRQVRTAHLYLGIVLAPFLLFFSISGAWQSLGFHQTLKDGSYEAPPALIQLSEVHARQRVGQKPGSRSSQAFKWLGFISGLGIATLAVLGLVMAFATSRKKMMPLGLLGVGVLLPVLLLWVGT